MAWQNDAKFCRQEAEHNVHLRGVRTSASTRKSCNMLMRQIRRQHLPKASGSTASNLCVRPIACLASLVDYAATRSFEELPLPRVEEI